MTNALEAQTQKFGALSIYILVVTFLFSPLSLHAFEIPYRDVIYGKRYLYINKCDTFEKTLLEFNTSYLDIYYNRSSNYFHDYHMSNFSLSGLYKKGMLIYGISLSRETLTLKQDNIFDKNSHLRGGRELSGGGFILGLVMKSSKLPFNLEKANIVGYLGENGGIVSSLEGEIVWQRGIRLYTHVFTYPSKINIYADINRNRFPFEFPFRIRDIKTKCMMLFDSFELNLIGGYNNLCGVGEENHGFKNLLYSTSYSASLEFSHFVKEFNKANHFSTKLKSRNTTIGFLLGIDQKWSTIDIGMEKDDIRYMEIRGFKLFNTKLRLDLVPLESKWLFLGWERGRLKYSGDSFLDVWPFSVWDIFTSKRYRLSDLDYFLDTYFTGIGAQFEKGILELSSEMRFEWWENKGTLRWLERKEILYPFFFQYVSHDETFKFLNKYAIQLQANSKLNLNNRWYLNLYIYSAIPLGHKVAPSSGGKNLMPKEKSRKHGGLYGSLSIIYKI